MKVLPKKSWIVLFQASIAYTPLAILAYFINGNSVKENIMFWMLCVGASFIALKLIAITR